MFQKLFIFIFVVSYLPLIPWRKWPKNFPILKGNKLLLSIYVLEEEAFCGRISTLPEKVDYKFFSSLIDLFLNYSRQFGIPLYNFLGEFKYHLGKDLLMEKKLWREFIEGIFQFIFIGVISLGFWWWSHFFLELKISLTINFYLAIFLQIFGLGIFIVFFFYLKIYFLKSFDPFFRSYYLFWGLSSVGLPVVDVLGSSQILELKPLNSNKKSLHLRAQVLVGNWKEKGLPVKEAMEGLIEELWALYEIRFQVFRRNLKILNFLLLALFYLSSFFILLIDFINLFFIELKSV